MSFMQPFITREDFHVGESKSGETIATPASVWGTIDRFIAEERIVRDAEIVVGKVWGRYSAPGYMDCTDWHGPFDTVEACAAELKEYYADDDDDDDGSDMYDGDTTPCPVCGGIAEGNTCCPPEKKS